MYLKFVSYFCMAIFAGLSIILYNYQPTDEDNPLMFENDKSDSDKYWINTTGCQMVKYKNVESSFAELFGELVPIECEGVPTLISSNNTHLWISLALNAVELKHHFGVNQPQQLNCSYTPFGRRHDTGTVFLDRDFLIDSFKPTRIDHEFVRLICENNGVEVYKDFRAFFKKPNAELAKEDRLNVLVFGVDSMSRLMLRRYMNQTLDLLKGYKGIEMFGYNKIGDNTYPNLVGVLTGKKDSELHAGCLKNNSKSYYDNCSMVWDLYKRSGYVTSFLEDTSAIGLFAYTREGFKEQPTDYHIGPIFRELEHHFGSNRLLILNTCFGSRPIIDVFLEMAKTHLDLIKEHNFFSFMWTTTVTHDICPNAMLMDGRAAAFLEQFHSTETSKNTFSIVFSDHGMRFGNFLSTSQGLLEDRHPFLFLMPPDWFKRKYRMAAINLHKNSHRLTTHFDLHETLVDLSNLQTLEDDEIKRRSQQLIDNNILPRGISLFLEIPETRTCQNAGIDHHWCTCSEGVTIPVDDERAQNAALYVVSDINLRLADVPECSQLRLDRIDEALLDESNVGFYKITVLFTTLPGGGKFYASVVYDEENEPSLSGDIGRSNIYTHQSHCIADWVVDRFCFCLDLL